MVIYKKINRYSLISILSISASAYSTWKLVSIPSSIISIWSLGIPYALQIATKGYKKALLEDEYLRKGLSFYFGDLTLKETGLKQNRPFKAPEEVLGL